MDGAVVKLDSLPDADRPTADHDRGFALQRQGLVFLFIGRIEIGRGGVKLRRACVHHLVDGPNVPFLPQLVHLFRQPIRQRADLRIGESGALHVAQQAGCQRLRQQPVLHRDDGVELVQEPWINARLD